MSPKLTHIIVAIAVLTGFFVSNARAQIKIDPFLNPSHESFFKASTLKNGVNNAATPVLIKTNDVETTAANIEAAGGSVHIVAGDIISATLPPDAIEQLASDEVIFVEGAKPVSTKNNVAIGEINGTEVHQGLNLPQAYSGKGVIVGLIDTGIDYNHADFKDAEGHNRILAIWDQTRSGGPSPSEINNSYGTECLENTIADGTCQIHDVDGHGTHVAGTLAGRHETYGGVAPDANIIAVTYDSSLSLDSGYPETIFSSKICEAAYYVFAKAEKLGQPAVINLSLGTHLGAHDGSSLFEQCLQNLISGKAGKAIVAAAGNEYSTEKTYTGIHAGFDVDGIKATNFVIRQVSKDRIYYIDVWANAGGNLSVGLAINEGTPKGRPLDYSELVTPGGTKEGSFASGAFTYLINSTETASALNGKQHIGIRISLSPAIKQPSKYTFDLVVQGRGSFDAWLFPDKPARLVNFTSIVGNKGGAWNYVEGDRLKSIAIPATAPNIIAVAGYTTKNRWDAGNDCCQISFELGYVLDFSSSGPSVDTKLTGIKPDISAPGGMIASALSSDSDPDELLVLSDKKHVLEAGTSMSAPFVSGTIALMFSANPNFTHEDVKKYIVKTAYSDSATDSVPNDRYGYGKLDILATLEAAIAGGASGTFSGNAAVEAPPPLSAAEHAENSKGGGGCSLVGTNQNSKTVSLLAHGLLLLISFLFISRMKKS